MTTKSLNRANYSYYEASELLNLPTATIIDMVNNGTLEHTGCGKRITRDSLQAAMAPESEQKWLHGEPKEPQPEFIPGHELEKKRLEFVEFQSTPHFRVDDLDYEIVERFITEAGMTMLPALLSCAAKAAARRGCFRNDLAAVRFVATAIEEEQEGGAE